MSCAIKKKQQPTTEQGAWKDFCRGETSCVPLCGFLLSRDLNLLSSLPLPPPIHWAPVAGPNGNNHTNFHTFMKASYKCRTTWGFKVIRWFSLRSIKTSIWLYGPSTLTAYITLINRYYPCHCWKQHRIWNTVAHSKPITGLKVSPEQGLSSC